MRWQSLSPTISIASMKTPPKHLGNWSANTASKGLLPNSNRRPARGPFMRRRRRPPGWTRPKIVYPGGRRALGGHTESLFRGGCELVRDPHRPRKCSTRPRNSVIIQTPGKRAKSRWQPNCRPTEKIYIFQLFIETLLHHSERFRVRRKTQSLRFLGRDSRIPTVEGP